MTVREYFDSRRDTKGRAQLEDGYWIDQRAGSYRLNGPNGTVLISADEDAGTIRNRLDDLNPRSASSSAVGM